jgi:IS1 family transposase
MVIMNKLNTAKRSAILSALVEGNSIRSTVRMTGTAKNTVLKLLADMGEASALYLHENIRNVTARRVQCDEIWSFVEMKEKNVPDERKGQRGVGDVWTWVAMDADSKLVISYLVGARDTDHATAFIADVASRLANRVQLTTDGHKPYLQAVEDGFGGAIDYAMLVKLYAASPGNTAQVRYSPGECIGAEKRPITGAPDEAYISTSYAERQNLTMRMRMRRFTRLTNAFSKKVENHEHAIAIYTLHYNFVRRHQTLRVTPAQKAGIDRRLWTIEDMVALLD